MLTFLMATFLFVGNPSSGPKVGEKLGDAKVKGIFEPIEGKEFNLLDRAKKEQTVIVFVQRKDQKDITRPTFRLLKDIDKAVGEEEKLNAIFVWVTDDVGKTEEFLNRAKGSLKFQMPVAISLDGNTGPNGYGLNDQVDVTILLAKDARVTANFAFVGPNETSAPKVIAAIRDLAAKK
jgi:hypothetical protein